MNGEQARSYFLSLPEALEDFPFSSDTPVFKIKSKMFGFLRYKEGVGHINLKCNPEEAMVMRDIFESVIPGYHMNKEHWNTVILDGTVPREEIESMIDTSYALVVQNLTKTDRLRLEIRHGKSRIFVTE
jgi:predicted DNA-binding protein (MmcQ/YjbR family)|tara:strand:- start:133 stop:519 length:387 start_codon:yes stop_codon:yes gene_type:complete